MAEWLERALDLFVGALVLVLLVKYRDRGILKRMGSRNIGSETGSRATDNGAGSSGESRCRLAAEEGPALSAGVPQQSRSPFA